MAAAIIRPQQISQAETNPLSTLMTARQFPTEVRIKLACNAAINLIQNAKMRERMQMHSHLITYSITQKQ